MYFMLSLLAIGCFFVSCYAVFITLKYKVLQDNKKLTDSYLVQSQALYETERERSLEKEKNIAQLEAKNNQLNKSQDEMLKSFKIMTNDVVTGSVRNIKEDSNRELQQLLFPLKRDIELFRKQIDDVVNLEIKNHSSLDAVLQKMHSAYEKMSDKTFELSSALKGDIGFQGRWGEFQLENILEISGLRKDHEYKVQSSSYSRETGQQLRPDVIICLPDNKHIIIDSKVSLQHYMSYVSEADEAKKNDYLNKLCRSMKSHVDQLASKEYQVNIEGCNSPNFVFMFVPIESAYILALKQFKDIHSYSWNKGISIVCPSILLSSLHTVASLWQIDKQNKNASEMALQAGRLYDKCSIFVDDFCKFGKLIDKVNLGYNSLYGKMFTGQGNIIARAKKMQDLGAKTTKKISNVPLSDLKGGIDTAPIHKQVIVPEEDESIPELEEVEQDTKKEAADIS